MMDRIRWWWWYIYPINDCNFHHWQFLPPRCHFLEHPSGSSSLPPRCLPPMLQHSWNQVCLLLKLILCFLIHLFSPFFLCFKLENRTCLYVNSQVTPKATNCTRLPPGKHLDVLYFFAIKSFLRGDLEKVKKHLKKNDINSLDGQGRYIKKLSDQRHSPPLSLCFWHLLTSDLLYLYL